MPEYRYFSFNSFWYLEQLNIQDDHFQQFCIRLYDMYVHLLQYFFTWRKKSFSHDLCYGKTAGRLWCILTFSSMSLCSNFKFHFITQMYISSNIFTRKKKSFSHHLRYGKSAWPFMMTPIMGRPDGTYGDNWDLPLCKPKITHDPSLNCNTYQC